MKFLSRVVWSEGMYLAPHHFQTQSRYVEDTLAFLIANLWREPWGFVHLALDAEAIRNGGVVLLGAAGLFEDGLPFDIPGADAPPPARNIADVFPSTELSLPLFLAVPRRMDNGLDAALDDSSSSARFRRCTRVFRDETNGLDEREVDLGSKNLRIATAAELTAETIALPLTRVNRDGHGHFVYDSEFVPACLRLSASDPLMLLLKRLLEAMGEKLAALSPASGRRGQFTAGASPSEVSNYWFLHALASSMPALRQAYVGRRAHPDEVFGELARLAGALCTFGLDSDPRDLPLYDHRDPGPGFRDLDRHIRRHLEIVLPANAIALRFQPAAPYIHEADIPDERCLRRARWVLGVRSGLGDAELIQAAPRLVKVCSARFVPELVKRALPGMTLSHLPTPPSAMRAEVDKQYFSVDTSGPCWEHILQTRRVGVYVPGEIAEADFDLNVLVEPSA
jgi:type VI secretion system protein ImpJ